MEAEKRIIKNFMYDIIIYARSPLAPMNVELKHESIGMAYYVDDLGCK